MTIPTIRMIGEPTAVDDRVPFSQSVSQSVRVRVGRRAIQTGTRHRRRCRRRESSVSGWVEKWFGVEKVVRFKGIFPTGIEMVEGGIGCG